MKRGFLLVLFSLCVASLAFSAPAFAAPDLSSTPTPVGTPAPLDLSAPIDEIVAALAENGGVPNAAGYAARLDDHEMSAASKGNFFWQPSGYAPADFALRADVSWKSASPSADWNVSGPGFVFHETENSAFYAVFLNLDGRVNLYRMDLAKQQGVKVASKRYGKLDVPEGSARIMLLVHENRIRFYVNEALVLDVKDERLKTSSGRLNYALASGTNKDFGIRTAMTDVDLWQFGDPAVLKATPVVPLSERRQFDLNTEKGIQAFERGEFEDAITSLDLAIKENAAYANALGYQYRGRAYYALGQVGKAVSDFNVSIGIDPLNAKTYLYRGYALEKQKKSAQAISDYSRALNLDADDVWVYRARAVTYASGKKYEQAHADLDRAIELDPDHIPAYNNRCWVNYLLKQYEQALPDCETAVKAEPDDVNYLESRAAVYTALGRKQDAARDLEKILTLSQDASLIQRVKQALKKVSP